MQGTKRFYTSLRVEDQIYKFKFKIIRFLTVDTLKIFGLIYKQKATFRDNDGRNIRTCVRPELWERD